jgi:hypothetical protein
MMPVYFAASVNFVQLALDFLESVHVSVDVVVSALSL